MDRPSEPGATAAQVLQAQSAPGRADSPASADSYDPADASLGELFSRMTSDVSTLVSQEVALAKVEIRDEVAKAGKGAGMLGGGGLMALLALLLLSFAGAWGLAEVMPAGFAFLIMGVLYLAIAGWLIATGRTELQRVHPKPEQTVETLKEDVQWAKQQKS